MMVDSIVAINSSPDSRKARTSPLQKESLVPARKTDAVARNRTGWPLYENHAQTKHPTATTISSRASVRLTWCGRIDLKRIKISKSERSLVDAVITASRDERGCNEMAGCVQHRGEDVGDRVDCDQDPDSFSRQTDGKKEWCQHDERAARNSRHGEGKEHSGESDRGNAAGGERHVVKPADEKRADCPRDRPRNLESGRGKR